MEGAIRGFRQHFLTSVTGRNLFEEQAKRGEAESKEAHRTYGNVSGTYRNIIEGAGSTAASHRTYWNAMGRITETPTTQSIVYVSPQQVTMHA